MERGIYKCSIFGGAIEVFFAAVNMTEKASALYPLEKLSKERYNVIENPEPIIFNTPLKDIPDTEFKLDKEDSMKKEGELEEVINLHEFL